MKITVGEIVLWGGEKINSSPFLIIKKLNSQNFLALPISKPAGKMLAWELRISRESLVKGEQLAPAKVTIFLPLVVKQQECGEIVAQVSREFLDSVLRDWVKFSAQAHYEAMNDSVSNEKRYFPPSGKVIGEPELFNMLESSLDMWLTAGRYNRAFEEKLSEFLNINHVLTVNSGSSANLLALTALRAPELGGKRLKAGDEVLTVAAGFPTTITPIIQNQLLPVFVDIELGNYNIDVAQIEEALTPKTKAIFIAHTLGNPFNLDAVMKIAEKYGLWVIEDNCDALGSKYQERYTGTFGHLATFSFYPAHHITMGEGGAVATSDPQIYKLLLSYRDWGRDCWCPPGEDNSCNRRFNWKFGQLPQGYDHKYVYSHLGYNFKITDWQAAIGLAQLQRLPEFIAKRKQNFKLLYQGMEKLKDWFILPEALKNVDPAWFGFILSVKDQDKLDKIGLVKYLEEHKIGTRPLFAGNILRHPAFTNGDINLRIRNSKLLNSSSLSEKHYQILPNSDFVTRHTFWLGLWPGVTEQHILNTLKVFQEYCR